MSHNNILTFIQHLKSFGFDEVFPSILCRNQLTAFLEQIATSSTINSISSINKNQLSSKIISEWLINKFFSFLFMNPSFSLALHLCWGNLLSSSLKNKVNTSPRNKLLNWSEILDRSFWWEEGRFPCWLKISINGVSRSKNYGIFFWSILCCCWTTLGRSSTLKEKCSKNFHSPCLWANSSSASTPQP